MSKQEMWVWGITTAVSLLGSLGVFRFVRKRLDLWFDHLAEKTHIDMFRNLDDILVGFAQDLYSTEIKHIKGTPQWDESAKNRALEILVSRARSHFGPDRLMRLTNEHSEPNKAVDMLLRSRAFNAITDAKIKGLTGKI